jgi:kynurenine formamidase
VDVPKFADLPVFVKTGEHHTWGVWGEGDQLGTMNFVTADHVKRAATLVKSGKVLNLSLPLNYPLGLYSGHRAGYDHQITVNRGGRDDYLNNFALQGSSQWDSLRHIRYREFGYYGGLQDEDVDGKGLLGIENWAKSGIIGRGILIDAAGYFEKQGRALVPDQKYSITPADIEAIASREGIEIESGDIVLLRTGWLTWHKTLSREQREAMRGRMTGEDGIEMPGLDGSMTTAGWLWDRRIAAMAADNVALEAMRVDPDIGFQHRRIIAMLGMPLGELWDLDELAADCDADSRYEFMLTSAPLYIPGGVGSPINAYALK